MAAGRARQCGSGQTAEPQRRTRHAAATRGPVASSRYPSHPDSRPPRLETRDAIMLSAQETAEPLRSVRGANQPSADRADGAEHDQEADVPRGIVRPAANVVDAEDHVVDDTLGNVEDPDADQ